MGRERSPQLLFVYRFWKTGLLSSVVHPLLSLQTPIGKFKLMVTQIALVKLRESPNTQGQKCEKEYCTTGKKTDRSRRKLRDAGDESKGYT